MNHYIHNPPPHLMQDILLRIDDEKRARTLRRHVLIMSPLLILATSGSAYAYSLLQSSLAASDFTQYASLILSDTSLVIQNIGSFVGVLVETAPVVTFAIFLTGVLGMLKTTESIWKDTKKLLGLSHKHHITYAN